MKLSQQKKMRQQEIMEDYVTEYPMPIPAARKSDCLKENARVADIKLTAKEIEKLDQQLDTMEMPDLFGGTNCKSC